jgi:hypothetical protein
MDYFVTLIFSVYDFLRFLGKTILIQGKKAWMISKPFLYRWYSNIKLFLLILWIAFALTVISFFEKEKESP